MDHVTAALPTDLAQMPDVIRRLSCDTTRGVSSLFERGTPIFVARAPGRLDVMGGIGDYSGSLVLQMPIAEAAFAAVQAAADGTATAVSLATGSDQAARSFSISPNGLKELQRVSYDLARQILGEQDRDSWAAYVLGSVVVLLREKQVELKHGLRILIRSDVPEGKGVSSSAAVEVATMRATAALLGIELDGEELARLCQIAENRVVGAPCGIMDQMTAAVGRENELLALRCQPAVVEGFAKIPARIAFWGIDSGIRHAVSGSDYTSVRCGAFMGYRILAEAVGLKARPSSDATGRVEINYTKWGSYLANVSPLEFREPIVSILPESMKGDEFLKRYGGTTDHVTRVDPLRTYAVRAPALLPIQGNVSVARFRELIEGPIAERHLVEMGELMAAAHESYSACGLGSEGTDLLVQLVREAGPKSGLYGAKITGGGSGGTVAILGRCDAEAAVDSVAAKYREMTGRQTYVFRGSSPGACATDVLRVTI